MPPKRRKFESTFPAARIKKIMQLDDDVGRVAASVPIVISRAVEIFLQNILQKSSEYASSRNAKTLTVGHLKHCIENEKQLDFLKDLTAKIPDLASNEAEDSPKRGRKRKNSASKTSSSGGSGGKKKTKKNEEVDEEGSNNEEDSDSSSPESCQSNNSHSRPKSTDPSPLAILHKRLSGTTTPSPSPSSSSTQSPLTALAANLSSNTSKGLIPNPLGGLIPNSKPTTAQPSPLLAYASSLSQSSSLPVSTPPTSFLSTQNLSTLTHGLGGGNHDNSEDEDYDA